VRFLKAIPKLEDWGAMKQNIESKDSTCQKFTQIFDSSGTSVIINRHLHRTPHFLTVNEKIARSGIRNSKTSSRNKRERRKRFNEISK